LVFCPNLFVLLKSLHGFFIVTANVVMHRLCGYFGLLGCLFGCFGGSPLAASDLVGGSFAIPPLFKF
jgi:hypothetical protein